MPEKGTLQRSHQGAHPEGQPNFTLEIYDALKPVFLSSYPI